MANPSIAAFTLTPSELARAPLTQAHSDIQRAGHLVRTRGLGLDREQELRTALSEAGYGLGSHADREAASAFESLAISRGIACYTRCWHLGEVGWFTIRASDYTRITTSDVPI